MVSLTIPPCQDRVYINFFSLKLKTLFLVIIIWSKTSMPMILPASMILLVISRSAFEGSGSPEGWLWTNIIEAAL